MGSRKMRCTFTQQALQVLAIAILGQRPGQLFKLFCSDKAVAKGNFFGAGDLQALPALPVSSQA
jgi:hypothetical protein